MSPIIAMDKVREDFPLLHDKAHNKPLIYLDSSATSLKPNVVIKAVDEYYQKYSANVHRGMYALSERATEAYELSRKKVAEFIHAKYEEVIFTRGTTDALNMAAKMLAVNVSTGDEIVLSVMEHHSNLVPWQVLAKEKGLQLKFARITAEGRLDLDHLYSLLSSKTKIVAITHVSNVLGVINDVKAIAQKAHAVGAIVVVDGAQSIPHMAIDVKDLDCDFFAFSSHKMFGPTGVGVLYGKKELLEKCEPVSFGGDMIAEVKLTGSSWNELPYKFEAGTPPIAEVIGLGAAVDYIQSIGMDNITKYEHELGTYALEQLEKVPGVTILGPKVMKNRCAVFSFVVDGVHPHDVATILDREGVCVRAGHLCAMPLVREVLQLPSVSRASFHMYNTKADVDALVLALNKVRKVFA